MRYVILNTNGDVSISQVEPYVWDKNVSRVLPVENFTDAEAIQSVVWQAFAMGDNLSSDERAKLVAEIDEYKAINKRLVETIDRLHETRSAANNCANGLRKILRGIMVKLSLQNVLQNTHSERNRENGSIIRDIHYWINKPVDEFSDDTKAMDDIPF